MRRYLEGGKDTWFNSQNIFSSLFSCIVLSSHIPYFWMFFYYKFSIWKLGFLENIQECNDKICFYILQKVGSKENIMNVLTKFGFMWILK